MPISDAIAGSGSSGSSGSSGGSGGSGGAGGGGAGVVAPATFTLCDSGRTGEIGRAVDVVVTGRVRTSKITCD